MNGAKESLARITAWVKEHPYISAAVLIGVVVLGYLAYKRGVFSGSSSSSASQDAANAGVDASGIPAESGVGSSSIPDMSGMGTPATGGNGTTTSASEAGTNNQGESNYGSLYESSVPLPLPQFNATPTLGDLSTIQSNAVSQMSGYSTGGGLAVQPGGIGSSTAKRATSPIAKAVAKNPSLASAKKPTPKRPAELVGKGPHFTGFYNGIYYLDGFINTNPSPITQATALHPGLASAKRLGY